MNLVEKKSFFDTFSHSLQEERRLARPTATAQETPFGLYGPPTPYTPSYF